MVGICIGRSRVNFDATVRSLDAIVDLLWH